MPVDELFGRSLGHSLPPDAAVGFAVGADGEGDVGEDAVAAQGRHGVGVGALAGAGSDAEESSLGVDATEFAGGIGLGLRYPDPGDVVADGGDLPALEARRRDEHGEVGLAAGRGECGGDVGLLGLAGAVGWRFHAEDKHVFGHPTLVAGDVGGDAQGEALLA